MQVTEKVRRVANSERVSARPGMRYDAVFLDVDGTLLWVDLDVEGYVRDLAPYSRDGALTVERAVGPVRESMRTHIEENINYPTEDELAEFKRINARKTAHALEVSAPLDVLAEVAERRISFNPYPESEGVLEELKSAGLPLYVVSNWDVLLGQVLAELDWMRFFDGVVASAIVGVEKPDPAIFEEALRVGGVRRERAVHVGNDPIADVQGAAQSGIDAVFVSRRGGEASGAVATLPDLGGLPSLILGR